MAEVSTTGQTVTPTQATSNRGAPSVSKAELAVRSIFALLSTVPAAGKLVLIAKERTKASKCLTGEEVEKQSIGGKTMKHVRQVLRREAGYTALELIPGIGSWIRQMHDRSAQQKHGADSFEGFSWKGIVLGENIQAALKLRDALIKAAEKQSSSSQTDDGEKASSEEPTAPKDAGKNIPSVERSDSKTSELSSELQEAVNTAVNAAVAEALKKQGKDAESVAKAPLDTGEDAESVAKAPLDTGEDAESVAKALSDTGEDAEDIAPAIDQADKASEDTASTVPSVDRDDSKAPELSSDHQEAITVGQTALTEAQESQQGGGKSISPKETTPTKALNEVIDDALGQFDKESPTKESSDV